MATPRIVTEAEAGQKLLSYLQRRLNVPPSAGHRWIRTGQVRLNGKRCKPYDRVAAGDAVRLPPAAFADKAVQTGECLPLPPQIFAGNGVIIFNKPASLPVQPGTGHSDSLATRLAAHYADADFVPAPAHRLDRDTTGLLAVGSTYAGLRRLQDAFAGLAPLRKEYLCWVHGRCLWQHPVSLDDCLQKKRVDSAERVLASAENGREARLFAQTLRLHEMDGMAYSLLHIRLMTGRTHQIRVQLSERGFPLLGDGKYGPTAQVPRGAGLYLHAFRLGVDGDCHVALPPWGDPWSVLDLPAAMSDV